MTGSIATEVRFPASLAFAKTRKLGTLRSAGNTFETNLTPLHWGNVSQAQWGGDGETIMQMSSLKSLKMPKLVFSSSPTRSAQSIRHVTSVSRCDLRQNGKPKCINDLSDYYEMNNIKLILYINII